MVRSLMGDRWRHNKQSVPFRWRNLPPDCGGLALSLDKHLAGCPLSIDEHEVFDWTKQGSVPDGESQWALGKVFLNMRSHEVWGTLFDGRACLDDIANLVILCGGDRNRLWNNMIRSVCPEVALAKLREDIGWE